MGNVDSIPIASQVKSIIQAAEGDHNGAARTQENFLRQCPGISQVTSVVQLAAGDEQGAAETQRQFICATVANLTFGALSVAELSRQMQLPQSHSSSGHSASTRNLQRREFQTRNCEPIRTSKPNIVIFGETGAGKSSMVNLLLGSKRAEISDGAVGCTFRFEMYDAGGYNLFDTVGLAEGSNGTVRQRDAVENLMRLMKSLESGVSLLILVMQKGRIKETLEKNYNLFVREICKNHVPVLLCITRCEMDVDRGSWWSQNKQYFDNYGMTFSAVVSGCCMDPACASPPMRECIENMNRETLTELKSQIEINLRHYPWIYSGGFSNWSNNIFL